MKKNVKSGLMIGIGVLTVFLLGNVLTYAFSEKTLLDFLEIEEAQEQRDYMRERMIVSEEVIQYDGYKFALEQYLFDRKTGSGCIQLSIKKDGKDMSTFLFDEDMDWYPRFGEDESLRFALAPYAGQVVKAESKKDSDKCTIYISFLNKDTIRSNKICLYDYQKGEKSNNYIVAEFELENHDYSIAIEGEAWAHLFLSYNMIQILWPTEKITDLSLGMKDGTEIVYYKDGKVMKQLKECAGKGGTLTLEELQVIGKLSVEDAIALQEAKVDDVVCFLPKNSINIQEVQYVKVNGKQYQCGKEKKNAN